MVWLSRESYFGRMGVYLAEMFPVPARLVSSALLYISFVMLLSRIHRVETSLSSLDTLVGIWSLFSLMLILRLMDELKDREIDLELFRDRPLPSGKVLESDIRLTLVGVIVLYVMANIWLGEVFLMALFVLGYALLMFKYFFIPRLLRKHLLLNLATHNPIVAIMLTYVVGIFAAQHGFALRDLDWSSSLLVIAMYWSLFFAWEIARKIRSPEEENAYVTYSQIFGRLGAVLVAIGAQTIAFGIGLYFYRTLSLSTIFLVILAAGYGMTVWGHARFLMKPNPVTSRLKPFAERYILTVLVAHTIEHGLVA